MTNAVPELLPWSSPACGTLLLDTYEYHSQLLICLKTERQEGLAQDAGSTCKRYASYFRPVPRISDKNTVLRAFPPYPNSYPRDLLHKQEGIRE